MPDAGFARIERLEVRGAAGGDQQVAGGDGFLRLALRRHHQFDPALPLPYRFHGSAGPDRHPLTGERIDDDLGAFGVVLRQRPSGLDDGHLRAQATERLAELEADGAAPDHHQV